MPEIRTELNLTRLQSRNVRPQVHYVKPEWIMYYKRFYEDIKHYLSLFEAKRIYYRADKCCFRGQRGLVNKLEILSWEVYTNFLGCS